MYSATPDDAPDSTLNNASPRELGGVRGAHLADDAADSADTAWETSTGRPDVAIAVLDSGIKWNDRNAMVDLRRKTRISKGEAKVPNHDRSSPLEPLPGCAHLRRLRGTSTTRTRTACSTCPTTPATTASATRVARKGRRARPTLLDPQDIIIAFSDGTDADHNGFVDDIAGWDFLDNDNDPYDDVQYGHGTGEARDSNAEADNGGDLGACPNCMVMPLRVGDSFVADVNRFAQAVLYAADNGVLVVQEALGALNNSTLAPQAIDYAYNHGVTVIASAADEAAQHNNWPSSHPHVILVNSVTKYDGTFTSQPPRSYLQFNGCTNFNAKITLAIPSTSCSSNATGLAAGMAGLIYSAALNAATHRAGSRRHPTCKRASGDPCLLSANEVRQLMATGTFGGRRTQADDVDFATDPESSPCRLRAAPTRTATRPTRAAGRLAAGHEQELPGPQRPRPVLRLRPREHADPRRRARPADDLRPRSRSPRRTGTRRSTRPRPRSTVAATCCARRRVHVPGARGARLLSQQRRDHRDAGRRLQGRAVRRVRRRHGAHGRLRRRAGRARPRRPEGAVPGQRRRTSDGREPGTGAQTSNGRPNTEPYGFVVKVVVTSTSGGQGHLGRGPAQPLPASRPRPAGGLPAQVPVGRRLLAAARRPRRRQPQRAGLRHQRRHRARAQVRRPRGAGLAGARRPPAAAHRRARVHERRGDR